MGTGLTMYGVKDLMHYKRNAENGSNAKRTKGVMRFGRKRYKSIIRINHKPIREVDRRLNARADALILS